jgi:dUTP pyrophosphatase
MCGVEEPRYYADQDQLVKVHDFDAGLDVRAGEAGEIPARSSALIGTGLYVQIPTGYVGLLWSRSGLSVKNRIEVGAGCIDSTYRGEVKVHLYNNSDEPFQYNRGDRLAQLLTIPVLLTHYTRVENRSDLSAADRGANGFGHTGVSS